MNALPSLVLGDLDLTDWSGQQYETSIIAEGTSRGAPVPIETAVESWLQDGSVVVTQGYDNREVTFRVRFRGPDLLMLAEAEAALFAELGRPNYLTWTPADGYGPPSVFVVVTSSFQEAPGPEGDLAEALVYPWRTYNVSLTCKAFVRSDHEVISTALESGTPPVTPTTVVVDDASTSTNWACNGLGGVVSGAYRCTFPSHYGRQLHTVTYMAAVDTSTTKFLTVDYRTGPSWNVVVEGQLAAVAAGQSLRLVTDSTLPSGFRRATFQVPASVSSLPAVEFRQSLFSNATQDTWFEITSLGRTNVAPFVGTRRQKVRTVEVYGSAPSEASLEISHSSAALGDVLLFTWTDDASGYSPPLRQFKVSGDTADGDTSLVSGARETLTGGWSAQVPVGQVPEGEGLLVGRLKSSAAGAVKILWSVDVRLGSNSLYSFVGSTRVTFAAANTWQVVHVAKHQFKQVLPPTMGVSAAVVAFGIQRDPGETATVTLDELWHFNIDRERGVGGVLSVLPCGSGTPSSGGPSSRVSVQSPTLERPYQTFYKGTQADGSDWLSFQPAVMMGVHRAVPPKLTLLAVTTGAEDASAVLRSWPCWHTHAGPLPASA